MKSALISCLVVTLALSLLGGLQTGKVAQAQSRVTPLGQFPIIPTHHNVLWFFRVDNPANPTTGHFWSVRLNSTGDNLPETLTLPSFIAGDFVDLATGSATGTIASSPTSDGWTSYQFALQVRGAGTQVYDVAKRAKVAQGSMQMTMGVSYDLGPNGKTLADVDPYIRSVLGPKAHETRELNGQGIFIRNFNFVVRGDGSGTDPATGRRVTWSFANVFLTARGVAVGSFSLH
jgi:hypothetical protein